MRTATTITLQDWIDYLQQGVDTIEDYSDPESIDEDRDNMLHEQIDKAHRRGVMSDRMVFDLHIHFDLVE